MSTKNETTQSSLKAAVSEAVLSTKGWYRANCPICVLRTGKDDRKRSMGFRPDSGFYKCFKCGAKGFINDDFSDMLLDLPEEEEVTKVEPPEGYMPLAEEPAATAFITNPPRKYLLSRGVPKSTWRACGIGVCLSGWFSQRIIIPIIYRGEWKGYVGRVWEDAYLNYLNSKGFKRADVLWNQDALDVDTDEPIIVVEGLFDGLPHYPHAVACLGKPAHNQVEILSRTKRPIVIALDGDAWEEGEATAMLLQFAGKTATHVRLPPRTDPGDIPPGDLVQIAKDAL